MSEFDETTAEEYQFPFTGLTDEQLVEEFRELSEDETQSLFTGEHQDPEVEWAIREWAEQQG